VLALIFAIPLGVLAAVRRRGLWSKLATSVSVLGLAIPNFWIAILAVLLFSVTLHWLPSAGYVSFTQNPLASAEHFLLPAVALAGLAASQLMRQVKASVSEVLTANHIRTARAKGLGEWTIVRRHVLRNASLSPLSLLGVILASLLAGSLIVEQIFLIPGMGEVLANSVLNRDYPLIQGGVLLAALIVIAVNLIVDIAYTVVDPRVKLQ
jgi:peptide/nickel transport system permease protein